MPFDPFKDRMARDIRNSLSSALVGELTGAEGASLTASMAEWLKKAPAPPYGDFIESRRQLYGQALSQIREVEAWNTRAQAVILWNAELYFELHELLETIWQGAKEPDRTGLKGVIQAAGAYLHSARGKQEAARKLALRAQAHLRKGAAALGFIANLDQLVDALGEVPPVPMRLVYREEG